MPRIYQKDGVWFKEPTIREQHREHLIDRAIEHSFGRAHPHALSEITGSKDIDATFESIRREIIDLRSAITSQSRDINSINAVSIKESHLKSLETKLFYNSWFFNNSSYSLMDFDSFENEDKLFFGKIKDNKLVPESDKEWSIYRTIKFMPLLNKPISRYMIHVDYTATGGAGLIVEISFDDGNKYHRVLSTVEDKNVGYYYQYPNFCDLDNSVPELGADSYIIRFRLLDKGECFVSSYGILLG